LKLKASADQKQVQKALEEIRKLDVNCSEPLVLRIEQMG